MNHRGQSGGVVPRAPRSSFVSSGRLTWLLVIAQTVLTLGAIAATPFRQMRAAVCGTQCDFGVAQAALIGGGVAVIVLAVTTTALLVYGRSQWARNWWIALLGLLLTAAAILVSELVFKAALPVA